MANDKVIARIQKLERNHAQVSEKISNVDSKLTKLGIFLEKLSLGQNIAIFSQAQPNYEPVSYKLANSVTGIVGLKEVITSKHPILKTLWTLLFCVGIAATIFFVYDTAMVYFNEPTVTKIKLDREFSNDFPPIVLCNDAWFDTNKVARLNMSTDAFVYSLGYTHYRSNVAPQISNISAARREFLNVFYKNKFRNLQNYYSSISIDLERASTKEDFYKSAVPSYSSSGDGPVKKILLPVYSICFSFPIQPLVGGLSLGFMFEEESILIKFADQTSGLFPASEDWFAFLGRDANSPFASPLLIKPFSNTVLKVKTQRFVVLAKKDAPCDDSKDSLAKCVTDCGSRLYKAARKCLLFWLSLDDRQQPPEAICNYFNVLELANTSAEAIVQAQWKNFKSKIKDCHKTCPRKCDRILHEMTLEAATNFNEFRTFDEIGTLKNHSNMTVAAIYVSHDAHGILTAEEVNAMSFTQLVNNVGGTLGLFVGGTLMTMAQLVLFCANHACRRRHNDVIGCPST